jgi:hypothetical protein
MPALRGGRLLLVFTAYWAPVWIPLGLLAQMAVLGLKPTLIERERLERERPVVEARHERTRARYERMSAEVEAWGDPVWRERWRRAQARQAKD